MNALDNERESRATDVLLGYETVKYFCNEDFELAQYDKATRQYQVRQSGLNKQTAIMASAAVFCSLTCTAVTCRALQTSRCFCPLANDLELCCCCCRLPSTGSWPSSAC